MVYVALNTVLYTINVIPIVNMSLIISKAALPMPADVGWSINNGGITDVGWSISYDRFSCRLGYQLHKQWLSIMCEIVAFLYSNHSHLTLAEM